MESTAEPPALQTSFFRPGMRIVVACSGGADSVALLRVLIEQHSQLGIVLSVAHVNHGIRGTESDGDQDFVGALAAQFDLHLHLGRGETRLRAATQHEGIEEAARHLRYAWFWELLAADEADAVVTAHTLDDQAETVLHRLMRGAWTEGLSGIHPTLRPSNPRQSNPGSRILRPFLSTTRHEVEGWLRAIDQPWREDSSNADTAYTRNRIRHHLLPALAEFNPQIKRQFEHIATLARDEEAYWQLELAKLLPSLLLPGKAVRGGGRATDTVHGHESISIEIERLRILHPALRRRVLRAAGAQLGFSISFDDTARLLALSDLGGPDETRHRSNAKLELERGLRAERTQRELRLFRSNAETSAEDAPAAPKYIFPIPGEIDAPHFGLRVIATVAKSVDRPPVNACLRAGHPNDRVTLRHRRSPLKLKDALKQALPRYVSHEGPQAVVEWQGEIVWVDGLQIESAIASASGLAVHASRRGAK